MKLYLFVATLLLQFCLLPLANSQKINSVEFTESINVFDEETFEETEINKLQFQIGAKASYSSSNEYAVSKDFYSSSVNVFNTLEYANSKGAYSFGISTYAESNYLFLSADVLYRNQTIDYTLRTITSDMDQWDDFRETSQIVHVPITAGLRFKQFKFGVGPMLNFPIAKNNAFEGRENITFKKRSLETGFQFTVGMKVKNVHIDLRRELNFVGIADNYYFNGSPATVRISPNKFSLNLAYYLN